MPRPKKGLLAELAPKVPTAAAYRPASCVDVFVEHGQVPGGNVERPTWLQPLADLLDDAMYRRPEGVGIQTAHAPPRHSKSSLLQAAIVLAAIRSPGRNVVYVAATQDLAMAARTRTEAMAISANLAPVGHDADLRFKGGLKARFTSVGSSLVGHDADLCILLDDTCASRADYESPTIRKRTEEWFTSEVLSRQSASVILSQHRWGTLDLSAFLQREYDAPYLRIPAICDSQPDPCGRSLGQALWPARYPLQKLALAQRNREVWLGLWQGTPPDSVLQRFGEPTYFSMPVPFGGEHRVIYGCDLAYSGQADSDASVLVRCVKTRGQLFVTDAVVIKAELDEAFAAFRVPYDRDPGATVHWHAALNELDVVKRMRAAGFRVQNHPTQGIPKHQRAIPLIGAWNRGDVLLNRDMQHRGEIVEQAKRFIAGGKSRDDTIDAMTSALVGAGLHENHDGLEEGLLRLKLGPPREAVSDAPFMRGRFARSSRRGRGSFWGEPRDD